MSRARFGTVVLIDAQASSYGARRLPMLLRRSALRGSTISKLPLRAAAITRLVTPPPMAGQQHGNKEIALTLIENSPKRTHAVSLVSRNEIGVGPAGSIGRERITQPLRPGDLSSRAVNHQVTMSVVD